MEQAFRDAIPLEPYDSTRKPTKFIIVKSSYFDNADANFVCNLLVQ